MLQLLNPIWLLAGLGIIIPIAIHLWNIKQGKTLKVGSIILLTRMSQEHARSLRLTELFLLFLRCLLILLLALLLANPYWQTSSQRGWVLMEKREVRQAYTNFKPLVDSLLASGYEFHFFDESFEKQDLPLVLKNAIDTVNTDEVSYWKLIKALDKRLAPGKPVYLFTGNKLNRFNGERPQIHMELSWKTFASADSSKTFIAKAYMMMKDSVMLVTGETKPSGTFYYQRTIATDKPQQGNITLNVANGNLTVRYKNDEPVIVDTTTMRISIFSDTYLNDAIYVQAAIRSIQQVSKRKISIGVVNTVSNIPTKPDWLFWLSEKAVPQQVTATNIFKYQGGSISAVRSLIYTAKNTENIDLYKRVSQTPNSAETIWKDGFGNPLLVKETLDGKQYYRFYSHFDPSWNDLPWSASFPGMIYTLLDSGSIQKTEERIDKSVIDGSQLQFDNAGLGKDTVQIKNTDTKNTKQVVWALIFIAFSIERYFSFKGKKELADA